MARGASALIRDLKQRGLLEDTIVLWTTEFGRMPFSQGSVGRDHNGQGFSIWLAGGGIKPGMTYGATFSAISKARLFAVVFGKNAEALGESIDYPAEKIVAVATHNPAPLKVKIDKVAL